MKNIRNFKTFENLWSESDATLYDPFDMIRYKQIDQLKSYIKRNRNLDILNNYGETLLFVVCERELSSIVDLMIEYGADINKLNENKIGTHTLMTPLHVAAYMNNLSIMISLIDNGAIWEIKNYLNFDFLQMCNTKIKNTIISLYPEKYKEYLRNNAAKDFNI